MRYSLTVTTPPAEEPVALAELKTSLRIDGNDEDAYLEDLISTAREVVEAETGRATVLTTYKLLTDRLYGELRLPRTPAVSITSLKYYDYAGTQQTYSPALYALRAGDAMRSGVVIPAYQTYWPSVRGYYDDVEIVFTAGYATADDVPKSLKRQILVLAGYWYERPESKGQDIKGFDKVYDALHNLNAVPHLAC